MVYFSLVPRPHLGTRLGVSMPSGLSTHYPGSVFHIYLGRARIGDLSHIDYLAFCCQSMHVHAFAILLGSWLQLAWKLYPFRFSLWKVNVQTDLSGMRWLYNPFSSYPCDVQYIAYLIYCRISYVGYTKYIVCEPFMYTASVPRQIGFIIW